jgi:hypothetical protein
VPAASRPFTTLAPLTAFATIAIAAALTTVSRTLLVGAFAAATLATASAAAMRLATLSAIAATIALATLAAGAAFAARFVTMPLRAMLAT